MPPGRESVCTGHVVDGARERRTAQMLDQDPVAAGWGETAAGQPSGLVRSPTFSSYGWNTDVAGQLTIPMEVGCAGHDMVVEGCSGARCTPASGTPYGGAPGQPWAGPHATLTAALTEWIQSGTFNVAGSGRFSVDDSGVVSRQSRS